MKYRIKKIVNECGQVYYLVQFKQHFIWRTLMNIGGPRTFLELGSAESAVNKLKMVGPPSVSYIYA